ncbi:hypothetical protein [Janthinobacterium sp. ZB1P44]|uniref:hypothetical protein n=1 Tax=Janthinobacterium sp. ZB1P44 TaxID=3424192 RepID=UPI003F27EE94
MLDVKKRIQVISALLEQGTPESTSYAALECRLAIEYLCYERMQMALDLASYADMGGWQPNKVVRAVEELVDEDITSLVTLSIAREPKLLPGQVLSLAEREKLEYHPIGTQAPLDLKKLTKLWNALASSALHVQVPKLRTDHLSIYGDVSRITEKVHQCLTELRKIGDGSLLSNGFGPEVSITCYGCGHPVRRRAERLTDKQTVSCVNPDCPESYTVEKVAVNDFTFDRRLVFFDCVDCGTLNNLPWRKVEKMKVFEVSDVACSGCNVLHKIGAQLGIVKAEVTGTGD